MIEILGEHSVDVSLLTKGNVCIDVGCLGFGFSKAMRDKGLEVWAFDIQDLRNEVIDNIQFYRNAITIHNGFERFTPNKDKQAINIYSIETGNVEMVTARNINDLYETKENFIDILKLDCEGSEYFILSDEHFQPFPKQISVEFHEHAFPELHKQYYEKCMENLLKYYNAVKHERTSQHGAGYNYWDSLFIRKDLC